MMRVSTIALTVGSAYVASAASHGANNCGTTSIKQGGTTFKIDYAKKATLTNLYCASSAVTQAACGNCCEMDKTKCYGATVTCDSGKFKDDAKSQTAIGTDAKAACCTAKAKCSTATCPAGYELDTTKSDTLCAGAKCIITIPGSVDWNVGCCKATATKCAAKQADGCGDTKKFNDRAKNGVAHGDAVGTNCCTAKGVCTGFTCPAGKKLKATPANLDCGSKAACDKDSTTDQNKCCEADTDKCGGISAGCAAGSFPDPAKAGTAKGTDPKVTCCTAKAKCSTATCPAGMKKKSDAATATCAGATCSVDKAGNDQNACCELNTAVCGGNTVTCDTGMYQDSTKAGTTAGTTTAEKKTNCCSKRTTCDAFIKADLSASAKGTTSAAWQPKGQVMQVVLALATVLSVKQSWP